MTKTEAAKLLKDMTADPALLKATAVAFFNDFDLGVTAGFVLHVLRIRELNELSARRAAVVPRVAHLAR